jgi:hypothetical protein
MSDMIYKIWHQVRSPFRIPQSCHRCTEWEIFDVDKAGCRDCGRYHHCGVACRAVVEDDHETCEITGCWIRNRNFQQGFTDTALPSSKGDPAQRKWVESDHVIRWLQVLVFSDTTRKCIDREVERITEKASMAFNKIAKSFKLEGKRPDILAMFAQTKFAMGNIRMPCRVQNQAMFDKLVQICLIAIVNFTSNFRQLLTPLVPPAKLDHFVIGLIYLLRTGIVMFDTIHVLPRVPELRKLLPIETSLKAQFRIPCKIITEVENITKIALKTLDRKELRRFLSLKT